MPEISLPVVVTAIANSELEGFVSGTLFAHGWSVIYRALDAHSLADFVEQEKNQLGNTVLIYSPDLLGLTADQISRTQRDIKQVIGFSVGASVDQGFFGLVQPPNDATSLLSLLRGVVRSPLIRSRSHELPLKRRARVIAIASPAGGAGCTTLAINLSMELSILSRETLLIDADVRRPSIAPLLAIHNLDASEIGRLVGPKFTVSEFVRERVEGITKYLENVLETFDFVIIDLGSVEELEDSLTDRRWTSSLIHWSCDQADEIWFLGKSDVLGIHRMEKLALNFGQASVRARISAVHNLGIPGKKGKDLELAFMTATSRLKPHRVLALPKDSRAVNLAEQARGALIEVNSRSTIRKAIHKLAVELST